MYLLSVAGLIACTDANLFEAFSCSWTSSATFYTLLEIERPIFKHWYPDMDLEVEAIAVVA